MGSRVTFRVDGSEKIGLGHLVRCLALADAVERQGGRASFVGRAFAPREGDLKPRRPLAEVAQELLKRPAPFRFDELPDGIDETEDARRTLAAAGEQGSDLVLVDHYRLGAVWWRAVRGELPLAAIDDVGRSDLGKNVDLVINPNAGAREDGYEPAPRILCGPRFVMLREEFFRHRDQREERWEEGTAACKARTDRDRRIVVSMGGSDPDGVTARVLRALRGVSGQFVVDVMPGACLARDASARRQAALDARIRLHTEPSCMPEVMARGHLAIVGGGSTTYECAFLGLPPLMIQLADNQAGVCRALSQANVGVFAGEWQSVVDEGLADEVRDMLADEGRIRNMSLAGMQLVDGQGSRRVAAAMTSIRDRG